MRTTAMRTMLAGVGLAIAIQAAAAQGGGREAPRGAAMPRYDVSTVETVRGEVLSVDTIPPATSGRMSGLHVVLRTRTGPVSVHLGPVAWLRQQSLRVVRGETMEVRGSRVTIGGAPALIAARVTKGRQVVTLRDSAGLPAWRPMARPMLPPRP